MKLACIWLVSFPVTWSLVFKFLQIRFPLWVVRSIWFVVVNCKTSFRLKKGSRYRFLIRLSYELHVAQFFLEQIIVAYLVKIFFGGGGLPCMEPVGLLPCSQ